MALPPQIEAALRARYADPKRAYHGEAHLEAMRALLSDLRPLCHDPDAIEIAIWFHDAVYEPLAADNEARSARLMREMLDSTVDPERLARAEAMILATRAHELPRDLPCDLRQDCALFLDLDLAVLGADAERFARYERAIFTEYVVHAGVPEPLFRQGRRRVLARFLAREHLYLTAHFRARFEAQARRNLTRALAAHSAPAR